MAYQSIKPLERLDYQAASNASSFKLVLPIATFLAASLSKLQLGALAAQLAEYLFE